MEWLASIWDELLNIAGVAVLGSIKEKIPYDIRAMKFNFCLNLALPHPDSVP